MKTFFRFVILYLAFALALVGLIRDTGQDMVVEALASTISFATVMAKSAQWLIPLGLVALYALYRQGFSKGAPRIAYALAASILLQTAFSFLKSSIPDIVPFYADPALAAFDRWLHGGIDPWVIAHDWGPTLHATSLLPAYLAVWSLPAIALPVVIALTDHDAERTARFLVLYAFVWLVIGNVFAVLGSSVGPVFYDPLLGSDRFAALTAALQSEGLANTRIGTVQAYLWKGYAEKSLALGSGISAFPSVHVAIATLTALYMAERSRWLVLPGAAFLAVILYLSVYTGYHYAVDGYASILAVWGLWAVLRRIQLTQLRGPLLRAREGTARAR